MVKTFVVFFSLSANIYGQVVLSEILSNEPSGRVRLEWVEIYNPVDMQVDLHDYLLIAGSDTTRLPFGSYVDGGAYAILARQLLPEDGSDSFEGYWGDSSGVWGDSEIENYPAFDVKMVLIIIRDQSCWLIHQAINSIISPGIHPLMMAALSKEMIFSMTFPDGMTVTIPTVPRRDVPIHLSPSAEKVLSAFP